MKVLISDVDSEFRRTHKEIVDELPSVNEMWVGTQDLLNYWMENYIMNYWIENHKIKIHRSRSNGAWESLEFNSEKDYILWLLKYS